MKKTVKDDQVIKNRVDDLEEEVDRLKEEMNYKEKKKEKKKKVFISESYTFSEIIPILVIVLALGMIFGGLGAYRSFHANRSKSLEEFTEVYEDIVANYYDEIDEDGMLKAGINGMIDFLDDRYASYLNKEASSEFNEKIDGSYVGIGVEIVYDAEKGTTSVYSVNENGPAYGTGLEKGDIIVKVNDTDVSKMTSSEIVKLVRGKENTIVNLTITRDGEEHSYSITRKAVDLISVNSKIIEYEDKKLGYLSVSVFSANTYKQFNDALKKIEGEGIDALIVDLRDNAGGHLTTVTDMLSLFNKKGAVLYQLKTKDVVEKFTDKTEESRNYPIAVLVNGVSASASEVFAANIKEVYGGIIIGKTTFGKGKVQKSYELANGETIKYTSQEWLTAKGESIDGIGVKPDVEVEYTYVENDHDTQLKAAITNIMKML